ncbi:RluA family pseudouridine synthase [Helicobacter sp. 11S03491-1]|uniref:RluA family pseudouridine synthase n=1 Tax=Helicobacter sp. 11S03491-1 TaxID=1476196 RepID=UPI000BA52A3C|nr:RluA family pseudouridine synthase [Helicobacter sp. 11S03491-1]PAF41599.1 RNA pseudouridine synthase [Helicobacter sp. 11S03491-1]
MEKAYKLLSLQEKISNKKAKTLIDKGLVSLKGKKIMLGRMELPKDSIFQISQVQKPKVIFEDKNILAVDKPPFIESYELAQMFKDRVLLHRLDKDTSGVILFVKDRSPFHLQAKNAFKNQEVYKEYLALVEGIVSQECEINKPILTIKTTHAKSKISKAGLQAQTYIKPLRIIGKKTLLEVVIKTGRTHQIRVHLKSIFHPIVGDNFYGGMDAKRLMLHAHKISLLGYEFVSQEPMEFQNL